MYRFLAILIGSAAFWWASGDWSCVLVFVIPACAVADFMLEPVICGLREKTARRRNLARVAVSGIIGLVTGHLMRVTPQWAFQEALKIDPPPGIKVQDIHRHYEGGPGEHTLIMECRATDAAIDEILKQFPPAVDDPQTRKWIEAGSDWNAAIHLDDHLATFPFSRFTFGWIKPMSQFQFYQLGLGNDGLTYPGNVTVLWEPTSLRAILVQRRY